MQFSFIKRWLKHAPMHKRKKTNMIAKAIWVCQTANISSCACISILWLFILIIMLRVSSVIIAVIFLQWVSYVYIFPTLALISVPFKNKRTRVCQKRCWYNYEGACLRQLTRDRGLWRCRWQRTTTMHASVTTEPTTTASQQRPIRRLSWSTSSWIRHRCRTSLLLLLSHSLTSLTPCVAMETYRMSRARTYHCWRRSRWPTPVDNDISINSTYILFEVISHF